MTDTLYLIWDWKNNEARSYVSDKAKAEAQAKTLNANNPTDWNGLPRFQVMEAND